MRRLIAAFVVVAAMGAGPALADTMQNAHDNTIVITYPNGAQARYHFNADGSFQALTPDGQTVTGTYEVAGDQICLTPQGGERGCTGYVGDKNVGDTWTQTATDGSQISVTLEAGR